ncbi:hypothetical protein DYB36_001111 [Aphanomyces astaci]|uniref:RNI-like protein n=3 Tax=Aphanomyces astaci TaxID=112090 RepID=A0A397A7S9_APHAT|nr:hypothetical protein DYB36_001111 [Aphanomyces astaci]
MSKRHLSPSPKTPTVLRKKREKAPVAVQALAQALFSGYVDSFVIIRVLSLVSRDLSTHGARIVRSLDLHATLRPHKLLSQCVLRRYHAGLLSLSLQWTPSTTDATVALVASSLPQLTNLNLHGCHKLTNDALATISAALPSLTSLDLSFCSGLTDPTSLSSLAHLQTLNLAMCSNLPKTTLTHLPTSLTSLDIGCTGSIDATACLRLFDRLQSLDLSGCSTVDANDIVTFTQATAPRLRHLSLAHCHSVHLSDLWHQWPQLPALKVLILRGIRGGSKPTATWTDRVKACCPSLTFLDISCSDHAVSIKKDLREMMPDLAVHDGHADFPIVACACDADDEGPRGVRRPADRVLVIRHAP